MEVSSTLIGSYGVLCGKVLGTHSLFCTAVFLSITWLPNGGAGLLMSDGSYTAMLGHGHTSDQVKASGDEAVAGEKPLCHW